MRAGALLAFVERAERRIRKDMQTQELEPAAVKAILDEIVRAELRRIIDGLDGPEPRSEAAIDARIMALEARIEALQQAARQRDFGLVEERVLQAAERLAIALEAPLPGPLGRQAVAKARNLAEAERAVEDGEDIGAAASPLIEEHLSGDLARAFEAPLTLGRAIEFAKEHATSCDMRNKYTATGRISLEVLGDVALHAITRADVERLMRFIFRLPKHHGKSHGKNRFRSEGRILAKAEEVRLADEADRKHIEAMAARSDISELEKRAQLKDLLVPRQTSANVQHHLNRFRGIFKAAARHLDYDGECGFLTDRELARIIRDIKPHDGLGFHHSLPKMRNCWSHERLQQLLLSPLYTGCQSRHRRAQPGKIIVRDSLYWVPLIVMTIGSRIDEILRLTKGGVMLRNSTVCLALNVSFTNDGKTDAAIRYIPVPELLLQLGFVDWVKALPGGPDAPLFPEVAAAAELTRLRDIFGKRVANLFRSLGIKDWNEDLYALRKTLSTALSMAGVADSKRQVIAGHSTGTILNIHYTSHQMESLKKVIDKVDFRLSIAWSQRHGFPVITGCDLAEPMVDVAVALASDGGAASITIGDTDGTRPELVVAIRGKARSGRSARGATLARDTTEAARLVRAALRGRKPRPLRDPARQRALDHLLMFAHPVNAAPGSEPASALDEVAQ